jgi:hypothetical protein
VTRKYGENLNFRVTPSQHDEVEQAVVALIARTKRLITVSEYCREVVLRAAREEISQSSKKDSEGDP